MSEFAKYLRELEFELEELETQTEDILVKAEKGIILSKNTLLKIRKHIFKHSFKNAENEIAFFKNFKPQVYSKLIYHVKLFNIESKRPRSSKKSQAKYLNNHIDRLQIFFNDNLEFYHYYRRGATAFDEQYFLRGRADIRLHSDAFHFFTDEQFSTSHDSTVATILAYDMLIVHLKKEIDKLNSNGMETFNSANSTNSTKLFWTGSKTDLIELIYALHSSGAINSGTADINEMATICERIFNIDLGHYYHTFIELKARKTNRTKFIDQLQLSLLKRMDESDE